MMQSSRCVVETECTGNDKRHKADSIEKALEKSDDKLKTWRVATKLEVLIKFC